MAEPVGSAGLRPWWSGLRWALPLLVVAPMLLLAGALNSRAVIFPVGAALTMGVWVLGLPGWSVSRWRVGALPPLFAVAGVVIARSGVPAWTGAILGVTVGLLALQVFDSRLAPALAAATLPSVFGVAEWTYPLAVLVVCLVLVAGMPWLSAPRGPVIPDDGTGRYSWTVVTGAWFLITTWIVVSDQLLLLPSAALAPPLFVSILEWIGRRAITLSSALRRWVLLVGAGIAGAVALEVVPVAWVAGLLAIAVTLVLMRVLDTPHAPALAIGLLPQILVAPDPVTYPLAVAAGAGALYGATTAAAALARRLRRTAPAT